jgi:hypothetical protein
VLPIVLVVASLLGFITMQLWNGLVPDLFGGPHVSFWQALGLLLLSRILFFGGPGRFARGGGRERWRRRFQERWEKMSPEERERLRGEWGSRCGWRHGEESEDATGMPA